MMRHCCTGQAVSVAMTRGTRMLTCTADAAGTYLEALLVVHEDKDPLGAERVDAPAHGVDAVPRIRDHVRVVQVGRQTHRGARRAAASNAVLPAACQVTAASVAVSTEQHGKCTPPERSAAWPAWGAFVLVCLYSTQA